MLSISVVQFLELVPFRYCREPLLPRAAPSCQLLRVAAAPGTPTQGMYIRQRLSRKLRDAQHRAAEMRELEGMGESTRECGLEVGLAPCGWGCPLNGEGRTRAGSWDLGLEVRRIQRAAGESSSLVSGLVWALKSQGSRDKCG